MRAHRRAVREALEGGRGASLDSGGRHGAPALRPEHALDQRPGRDLQPERAQRVREAERRGARQPDRRPLDRGARSPLGGGRAALGRGSRAPARARGAGLRRHGRPRRRVARGARGAHGRRRRPLPSRRPAPRASWRRGSSRSRAASAPSATRAGCSGTTSGGTPRSRRRCARPTGPDRVGRRAPRARPVAWTSPRRPRVAIEKAGRSASPTSLEPGDHPAILEPACVASLLRLFLYSLDARSADEGRAQRLLGRERGDAPRRGDVPVRHRPPLGPGRSRRVERSVERRRLAARRDPVGAGGRARAPLVRALLGGEAGARAAAPGSERAHGGREGGASRTWCGARSAPCS